MRVWPQASSRPCNRSAAHSASRSWRCSSSGFLRQGRRDEVREQPLRESLRGRHDLQPRGCLRGGPSDFLDRPTAEECDGSWQASQIRLLAQAKFTCSIKLICPVQSCLQKYSPSRFTQIKSRNLAVPPPLRGVSRSSRTKLES